MASPIPQHVQAGSSNPNSHTPPRSSRHRPSPHSSPQHSSPQSNSSRVASGTAEIENLIRGHGGDVRKALEAMVMEKTQLQSQNSQLWKLIEKQRSQCAQLNADNERLRTDRERANTKLSAAGLDVVGNTRKLPNSSSAVGLGIRADPSPPPQMPRRNSDRDELKDENDHGNGSGNGNGVNGSLTAPILQSAHAIQAPPASASAPSPSPAQAPKELLPSPIPSKLRHESRIIFPPEVSSFMTLADSPKEAEHTIPTLPTSTSMTTISPTSQYSSSPANSAGGEPREMVAPNSSRRLAVMTEVEEEGELEGLGHPRMTNIKSPSMESTSTASSFLSASAVQSSPQPSQLRQAPAERPSLDIDTPRASHDTQSRSNQIYPSRGPSNDTASRPSTESSASRSLPRMTAALLPHARITIPDTTIYPNALGRDVLCFIINISVRPPNSPPIVWHIAKLLSAFIDLDQRIRTNSGKRTKEWKTMVAPLPDGKAWKDFAPSKIDQRKSALEVYLQSLQVAPLSDKTDLCNFLSTDPVQVKAAGARKEGYLTKKGKNWGGWKTRYFALDGPVMEYYETRGGQALGSIIITNAQIGRQNRPSENSEERDFRHAFLIIEQAKKGTQTRHVLCAASDMDRDSWIEVLVQHVDPKPAPIPLQWDSPPLSTQSRIVSAPTAGPTTISALTPTPTPAPAPSPAPAPPPQSAPTPSAPSGLQRKRSGSRKLSKDVVVTNAQPLSSMPAMPGAMSDKFGNAPSPSLINSMETQKSSGQVPHTQSMQSIASATSTQASMTSHGSNLMSISESGSSSAYPSRSNGHPPPSHAHALDNTHHDPTPRSTKRQSSVPPRHFTPAYLTQLSTNGMSAPPGHLPDTSNKERDRKAKSGRFWPSFGKTPEKVTRPVFGIPLTDSLAIASVASLPAIVFRCIEYLETKNAQDEEGIYRLSGSSAVIKGLKERFDIEGDFNLLKVDDNWDPHAIAGLLKTFLRELPTSLLTRELHPKYLAVMDLIDSSARVAELSRLVSDLPPPNYALLRALTAHLILIVKHSTTNKMTLRNIGIVFSPTLGIPAGIFSELVSHFGAIFDAEPEEPEPIIEAGDGNSQPSQDNGTATGTGLEIPGEGIEDTVKRKRNSMLYQAAGADAMLGIGGRSLDPMLDDSASEVSTTDFESEIHSAPSSDHAHSPYPDQGSPTTPKADRYPPAAAARRAKVFIGAHQPQGGPVSGSGSGSGFNGTEGYGGQGDMMLGQNQGQGQGHGHGQGRGMPASPRPEPTRAG